jgi:membrane peptidoglycan carboxypeptidase
LSFFADLRKLSSVVEFAAVRAPDHELTQLILALEDKRFRRHRGVDWIALIRATMRYVTGDPKGGASTIDMQLVRTITDRRERSLRRKMREIVLALVLRRRLGADHVLAWYLSVAYCGVGATGIEQAAVALFGRRSGDCSMEQKAALASLLLHPIPGRRGFHWWRRVVRRSRIAKARTHRVRG